MKRFSSPAPGLPRLQFVSFGPASLGYGDLFIAAVLGGVLAAEGARGWRWALVAYALAEAFTLLFYVTDTLPATVPIAATLLVREALRYRQGRHVAPAMRMGAVPD